MGLITKLIISLVIAALASTLTNILKTGEIFDLQLLIAFFLATATTALSVGKLDTAATTVPARTTAAGTVKGAAQRERGTVKWFNVSKGFGFIVRENGEEIFVHFRSIRGEGRRGLRDGQSVSFVVAQSDKGPQAEDVAGED
jgi:CspA family cold shock protein